MRLLHQLQIQSDDLNFLRQKLAIIESKERDQAFAIKSGDSEVARRVLEDRVRGLNADLNDKKSEIKHLEKHISDLKNQNVILEKAIESLRLVVQQSEGRNSSQEVSHQKEAELNELKDIISSQDLKINRLKSRVKDKEIERSEFERNADDARRQLNGSLANARMDLNTKARNNFDSTNLRAKVVKLQGELAQKDLKIESLSQKISYMKQREVAKGRVRDNLNEFHRDLFGSFEMFKKR